MKITNILTTISNYINNNLQKKLNIIFITALLIFCIGNLLLTPPFQVADEHNHFLKAYQISKGKLLGIKQNHPVLSVELSGAYLPKTLKKDVRLFDDLVFTDKKISRQEFIRRMMVSKNLNAENTRVEEFIEFPNTVIYPPTPYLPQSVAIFVSRFLNFNTIQALYFARILTLITSLGIIYYAFIQVTFSLKIRLIIFFLLGLPTTAFQLASSSADSITISLSILVVAIGLKLKHFWQNKDFRIFLFISFFLSLCKFPYFMISWLIFPSILKLSNTRKDKIKKILLVLLVSIIPSLAWQIIASQIAVNLRIGPGYDIKAQLVFFLHQPLQVSLIFMKSLWENNFYIGGITGRIGWNVVIDNNIRLICIFLLFMSSIIGYKKESNYEKINLSFLVTNIGLFITINYLVLLTLYLVWNKAISGNLYGVQGRYFLPSLLLVLISIPSVYQLKKYENFYIIFILSLWFVVSYNVLLYLNYRFWISE